MVEYNNFWDGTTLGKAGPYSSQIFAAFMQDLLAAHGNLNAGILTGRGNGVDDPLDVQQTSPASKQVVIKPGSAIVPQLSSTEPKGARWYYSDSDTNVTIPDNTDGSGFDRIDLLVLRSNSTTQTITPVLITGTPAGVPVAPTPVRSGAIYDIILAEITAQNLFVTITTADIDTTVQLHTPVWTTINGGTGIEGGFVTGDMIGADAAETMVRVSLDDFHSPMRDDSQANGFGQAVIPAALLTYELPHATNGATATINVWNTLPFNNVDDQAGLLTSLSGGTMTLERDGEYIIENVWASWDNTTGGTQQMQFRIFNVTTATEIDRGVARDVSTVAQYAGEIGILQPIRFTASAGDQIEIQMFMEDNGATNFIWGLNRNIAINGADQPELYAWGTLRKVG